MLLYYVSYIVRSMTWLSNECLIVHVCITVTLMSSIQVQGNSILIHISSLLQMRTGSGWRDMQVWMLEMQIHQVPDGVPIKTSLWIPFLHKIL